MTVTNFLVLLIITSIISNAVCVWLAYKEKEINKEIDERIKELSKETYDINHK